MPSAQPLYPLSAASAKVILRAARSAEPLTPEQVEGARLWLEEALSRAMNRASGRPIVMKDVDRLDRAFRRFNMVIESLQDRDNPPPRIPISEGTTDWDHWLIEYRHFGFKRGRRAETDWKLISALLAFYEVTSKARASAAQPNGPTMRFLRVALGELAAQAPATFRSYFDPPNAEALRQQLPKHRKLAIPRESKKLVKLLAANTVE